ncbi:MAG: DNA-3-methyladenine glycosylase I [Gammaproteobacteria bacterium]|nr:DNA-3-methyladenine glycosylase I [Gammaproteobacteria bacterium]
MNNKSRCSWVNIDKPLSVAYHDAEWGVPCFDDRKLFEMLLLEGAQAGLSWNTILNKREHYREAFDNFDVKKISQYDENKIQDLLKNAGIVRNKLKINSAINNAKVFLEIQKEFGNFSTYVWAFTNQCVITSNYDDYTKAPTKTEISDALSKDLKTRGMNFVGSTIMYAYMQAIGMVNDHQTNCFCRM